MGKLTKGIVAIAEKDYPGVSVKDAVCPKNIKPKTGSVFQCTVKVGGKILTYNVTQKDKHGNVNILPKQAVISNHKAVDFLERALMKARKEVVTVDCGKDDLLILAPGSEYTCQVQTPTQKGFVKFKVKDIEGNVTIV